MEDAQAVQAESTSEAPGGLQTVAREKRHRIVGKQSPEGYYAKRHCGEGGVATSATTAAPRQEKRKREAPDTLQAVDEGGHLMYVQDGIYWCWRCGCCSRKRLHDLNGTCYGEPRPGEAYRLKRLKNSKHPITNAPLAGLPARQLVLSRCGLFVMFTWMLPQ